MKSRVTAMGWSGFLVLAAAMAAAACGGDDGGAGPDAAPQTNHVDNPQPASGGGVGSGAVNGELNVFVLDARTKAVIEGADVTVVRSAAPLTGKTDSKGLHTFTDAGLAGAQVIAVSAAGHVPATWYGANGAVVTVTLDPTDAAPAPDTAQVSGTMSLAAPTQANHFSAAIVLYSFTRNLDAPENKIQQPTGPGPNDPPLDVCVRPLIGSTCSWSLVTRTGAQTHYAIIVDVDTKGTATNSDDSFTVTGFAGRSGINLTKDQTVTNETLTTLDAGDVATLNVTFPASAPTGLAQVAAIPILQLGDERMIFPLPSISPAASSAKVPKASGPFAGGKWTVIAQAKVSGMASDPASSIFKRDLDPAQTVTLGEFPALPTGLAAGGGTFSFAQVAGASLHLAEVDDSTGKPLWKAVVLDATKELSITQTPDPLPAGSLKLKVVAGSVAGFDAGNFTVDDVIEKIDTLSSQVATFQH